MGKKVLIIDDDLETGQMLGLKLKACGYDVVVAQDPMFGLKSAHSEKPDIVILDLMMPAGGGLFFLDKITKSMNTNMISVIVTSATQDKEMVKKVSDKGVLFVQKPYDIDALIEKIKLVLEGSINSIPKNTPNE